MILIKNGQVCKLVNIKPYGDFGSRPIDEMECPLNYESSCESASGGSACGRFFGETIVDGLPYCLCLIE